MDLITEVVDLINPLNTIAAICGHGTRREGEVSAYGKTRKIKMPLNDDGKADYCLDCIGKMTIKCAWCERPIFIGDQVTLKRPATSFEMPEGAVIHSQNPPILVGCLRLDCTESEADRAGFWLPGRNGIAQVCRFRNTYETEKDKEAPSAPKTGGSPPDEIA